MLLCMTSSPQQSLQSRLFGFWAPSGDEITVLKIDTDSFRYFFGLFLCLYHYFL